ncbi:MAG TPA: hypothetical protein DD381_10535 [Lentisphaeria bacterium]|nr:MAG: hypothetical protein A2X47_02135 [Lentisphaerae bacterium GWF2_38_69]HBM16763.1 hypothetical protein [Lentisphaeria bacterium]
MKRILTLVFLMFISLALASQESDKEAYLKDLNASKDHQFNKNQIKSFAFYWFSLHDRHVDINESYEFLDKNNLYMVFPEITVRNLKDYKEWYDGVGKNIKSNIHYISRVNVSFDGSHKYIVKVLVNWQAIDKDGNFLDKDVTQEWTLVDPSSDEVKHPLVEKYIISSFKDKFQQE